MSTFHPPPHLMPLHSHTLQPQSSATRDVELQYDKVDAEASSILIALANHNRKEQHASEMAAAAAMKSLAAATGQDLSCASFLAATKRRIPVYDVKVGTASSGSNRRSSNERKSISPSQDTNVLSGRHRPSKRPAPPTTEDHPRQKLPAVEKSTSPSKDPILLLAAAAAAVDSKHQEDAHDRHRASASSSASYERPHSAETKPNVDLLDRAPFPTDTSNHAAYPTSNSQQPVYDSYYSSTENHRSSSPPSQRAMDFSSSPHMMSSNRDGPPRNSSMSQPPPSQSAYLRSSDRSNVFSHQYLSMKQNPKIKRNAMHAYITYMIYADSSHNGNQTAVATLKDGKSSNNVRLKTTSGPSSTGSRSYASTPTNPSSTYYNGPEKEVARYPYRREEKPYSSASSSRSGGYHNYAQPPESASSRTPYPFDNYAHRSQMETDRSNGSMSRISTPSLPPLSSANGSTNNNRSPYGSDYYSPSQQRNSSSWSRSSVPPPSLPPLQGYTSSRVSPTLRPSILPPPSANEGRSSIPPPLPLPTSTRDQASSTAPNSNIFNRPLTAFLWSDNAAPPRPSLNDRILPPVPKPGNDHSRPDSSYYDRP